MFLIILQLIFYFISIHREKQPYLSPEILFYILLYQNI